MIFFMSDFFLSGPNFLYIEQDLMDSFPYPTTMHPIREAQELIFQ
jgi:hypothetical protein